MNIAYVNTSSCGGSGLKKWKRIRDYLKNESISFIFADICNKEEDIRKYLNKGIFNFIAVGGDGTVNFVLNKIISAASPSQLEGIKLGAVGIGSSNDFHKPYNGSGLIPGIPAKIDFNSAEKRDIGCISYTEDFVKRRKYFLVNASTGITAEANNFFNNPDKLLSWLKKMNTGLSILYCAVKTIFGYNNYKISLYSKESGRINTTITNLGVVKNPNFSGNLKYNTQPDYSSGSFDIFLCHDMKRNEAFGLLYLLGKGRLDKVAKQMHWKTNELTVSSDKPFIVEFDGEIIKTNHVTFSVLPRLIGVCTC